MTAEVLEHRIATLEREVNDNMRPHIHRIANEATKVEFLVRMQESAQAAAKAQYDAINAELRLINEKLSQRGEDDAARHAKYDEHLAKCDRKDHWRGYITAGLIIALAGSTFATLMQFLRGG